MVAHIYSFAVHGSACQMISTVTARSISEFLYTRTRKAGGSRYLGLINRLKDYPVITLV
jgi:hypothetical protein